jgi:hypothetical protein
MAGSVGAVAQPQPLTSRSKHKGGNAMGVKLAFRPRFSLDGWYRLLFMAPTPLIEQCSINMPKKTGYPAFY